MRSKIVFLIMALALFSCKGIKNGKTQENEVKEITVDLPDTLRISPEDGSYRGTAERLNDLIHTKLDLHFDYLKQHVLGKATLTLKPYFYPTNMLELDAKGFDIHKVRLNSDGSSDSVNYTYNGQKIKIDLKKEFKNTETYQIYIEYTAKPNELEAKGSFAITDARGLYFINPERKDPNKPRQIWTQGETEASSAWFPTIDVPNEKMTQEIAITVDEKDQTLSNGELVFSSMNNDGTRTDFWKQSLPHAPYLTMIAVGEFAIVKDSWKGKEVSYYVEPAYEKYARMVFGRTPEMIEFYSKQLKFEYPWSKYSQIVVRDYVSGAMENTGAVVFFGGMQHDEFEHLDEDHEDIVAHELFHHWFGDLVTCESWSNLPLNESFATYGEYLWIEHKYGRMEADKHLDNDLSAYLSEAQSKQENLIRFQYADKEEMFDAHSYQKGGRVLHMLRKYVGDEAFFKSLNLYLEKNKFKSVEIHDLRLAFEEVTGKDLNWFFNQWFLGKGHPVLVISDNYNPTTKEVTINVNQDQKEGAQIFRIPVKIDIYSGGKVIRKEAVLEKASHEFVFQVDSQPSLVNFDAEKMLLGEKMLNHTPEQYLFMFKNAPLFLDKAEALKNMELFLSKEGYMPAIKKMIFDGLNHEFWAVRLEALNLIKSLPEPEKTVFKEALQKRSSTDSKAAIRAEAIALLSGFREIGLVPFFKEKLNDSSYNVRGSALDAITEVDPAAGVQIAESLRGSKNGSIHQRVSDILAVHGNANYNQYYDSVVGNYGTYNYSILSSFGTYLERAKTLVAREGLDIFKSKTTGATDMISKLISYSIMVQLSESYKERVKELQGRSKDKNDPEVQKEIKMLNEMIEICTSSNPGIKIEMQH